MKAVILAGGLGTRLSEETEVRPKPMIEIGGKPILWHIMKIYSAYGINDFVICCGYKGYMIKEYFANYYLHNSDVTFDMSKTDIQIHQNTSEPWRVTLVDTGEQSMTGGRIKRVEPYVLGKNFCMTYGDGVADIDLRQLINFHEKNQRIATLTAVRPPSRFGALELDGDTVTKFSEKSKDNSGWINGGFFVLSPQVFEMIADDSITFEKDPLDQLVSQSQLNAYRHTGFWHPMDTLRDKKYLESLWASGRAPWKIWE